MRRRRVWCFGEIRDSLTCLFISLFLCSTTAINLNVNTNSSSGFLATNTVYNDDVDLLQNQPKVITVKDKKVLRYSYNITADWEFIITQAHTQYRNLSLSLFHETYIQSDTAIFRSTAYKWSRIRRGGVSSSTHSLDYILQPSSGSSLETLVAAITYTGKSPIPGGCCLTCNLEVDPNLIITTHSYYKSVLLFSVANVYDFETSLCSGLPHENPHHYRLQYSIYQYFLEEGNLDNDELFDGLTKMLTPTSVKQHGTKIREWNPEKDVPSIVFDTERGQGVVFNILVYDPETNMESVYSPVVTYGCSFTAKVDGCDSLVSIVNLVLAVCGSLFGLFICFFGHRFCKLYIAVSGLTLFSFCGFIILTNKTDWTHTARMIGSVCIGTVGGALLYLFWWCSGFRNVVLYICGLTFGFLLTAVLFFTPFGNFDNWKNDVNYWTVVLCMSLSIPFMFLLCLKTFVILVASLVGAYGFVVGIDTFIHSSLSYIVLDLVMKATVDGFVKYDIPFQSKDYILATVWFALTVLGLAVQLTMSKGKETLPPRNTNRKRGNTEGKRTSRTVNTVPQNIQEDDCHPVLVDSRNDRRREFDDDNQDERLPILVQSRSAIPRESTNRQHSTRYGTNIVC